MRLVTYVALSSLLILSGYLVFRVKVRRDYKKRGKLSAVASWLQVLVFVLHANFSYTFLPATWPALPSLPENKIHLALGLGILAIGIVITLSAMISLGLRKAVGQKTGSLNRSGFYRYSRNPQIVVYGLVVIGAATLWPSVYGLGWVLIYGVIAHMMVRTEEEHLCRTFGSEFEAYRDDVPRYLPWLR